MTSFCLKPNTVFPTCKLKILKILYVVGRVNIWYDRVDLNVNTKQQRIWIVHISTIWLRKSTHCNFVYLPIVGVKIAGDKFYIHS